MRLSATGKVVLGMLSVEDMSGYDIKSYVDNCTRFFWAASYGQIYPELKKLAAEGLIEGRASSQGGRRRTVYSLTESGRRALEEWMDRPGDFVELRHEALLEVFFAEALPPRERVAKMRELAAGERLRIEALGQLAIDLRRQRGDADEGTTRKMVLEFGIGFHGWIADWWERQADELERELAVEAGAAD